MADESKLKAARDSYLRAAGLDPDEMSEEQRQARYEEELRKKKAEESGEEPSALDKMLKILREGISGTGSSSGYTESIKRRQKMEKAKGKGSSLRPPEEEK